MRLLQHKDLQINVPGTFNGIRLSTLEVMDQHVDIAKILLATNNNRTNVNGRDRYGRAQLYHAVISKQKAPILLLLSRRKVELTSIYEISRDALPS
ncbi:uncharacterized protein BDW43DRAFT_271311, partial [Aspergillus alliaceus]|uniref:uncharacterized protein n=1 Tax=Petromyces alliaceus TaxID=209559 RepID=UPI0012A611DB